MFTYRGLLLALVLCSSLGCKSGIAVSNKGFCAQWALVDVRIGLTYCNAGDVELTHDKEASSEQFMEMAEEVVPDMVNAAVRAALACAGIGVVGGTLGGCDLKPPVEVTQ